MSDEIELAQPNNKELVIKSRPYDKLLFVDFYAESGPVSSAGTTTLTIYLDSSTFATVEIETSTTESTSGRSRQVFRVFANSDREYFMVVWGARTTGTANITGAVANLILV